MFEFKMPSMGADMENGIVVAWNFAVGDRVKKGDIICEIETAKGNIDVEVWESGTLVEIRTEPGTKVPVGETMAVINTGAAEAPVTPKEAAAPDAAAPDAAAPDAAAPDAAAPDTAAPDAAAPDAAAPDAVAPDAAAPDAAEPAPAERQASASKTGGPTLASPAARGLARDLGVDLTTIAGTGPDGAVKLVDVQSAADRPRAHHRHVTPVAQRMIDEAGLDPDSIPATGPGDSLTKADIQRAIGQRAPTREAAAGAVDPLREAIAKAMSKSKREIPHYYLKVTVDVTDTVAWLRSQNEERSIQERLLFGAVLASAVARAAADVPGMNGFYAERFEPSAAVHLGFAVAMRGGGVVAPAIHDADAKSLDEVMSAIKDVVRRVRSGKLRASEMTDPTITLTSLGEMGVDSVFGIIYPPQVAIVGAGSPREVATAHDGMVGVRTCLDLTLSGDHRASDGMTGAKFLQAVARYLQHPEEL